MEDPQTIEEVRENEEFYQDRIDWWEEQNPGHMLGSVLLPHEGASDMAARAYHECMTEHGELGIEYAQEGLHQNHDYFDDFFDSVEEVREDVERFGDIAEQ